MSSDNLQSFHPRVESSTENPISGSGSLLGPNAPVVHPSSWPTDVLQNMTESLWDVLKALMSFRYKIGRV